MFEHFPELGLRRGHRFMENGPVTDVADLGHLIFPCDLTFFDANGDTALNCISPSLVSIPGFSIESLHLDAMHILDLGVSQHLVGAVFRRLIDNNFAGSDHPYVQMRRMANLQHLRRRLRKYYNSVKTERGRMTRISRLSLKMLGKPSQPCLHAKAAETRHLVPLLSKLCRENPTKLGANAAYLTRACNELNNFYNCMNSNGRDMSPGALRILETSMARFLASWRAWGGHMVPKHHMAWHMAQRARQHGNPKYYWTYPDESENRTMSAVAKVLHGGKTFYQAFLQRVLPEACA